MTWDWDGLDRLGYSGGLPAWLAVGAAAFFGLLFLLTLVRAERTIANGSLAALTFTGLAIAAIVGLRSAPETPREQAVSAPLPAIAALSCIDDLAGDTALAACEKALFSAPDTVAAAVAYTASRVNRLVALGSASRATTPDQQALRNSIERDRYGLVAYVLSARDRCQPADCSAYAAMTDHNQVAANMEGLIYEGLVAKYAPNWAANATNPPAVAVATGKPSSVDFPTSSSIPPVNIMTPEPSLARPEPPPSSQPQAAVPPVAPQPPAAAPAGTGGPYVTARSTSGPKKRAPAKRAPPASGSSEPVQLAPALAAEQ